LVMIMCLCFVMVVVVVVVVVVYVHVYVHVCECVCVCVCVCELHWCVRLCWLVSLGLCVCPFVRAASVACPLHTSPRHLPFKECGFVRVPAPQSGCWVTVTTAPA
jgi:hypothetical protein